MEHSREADVLKAIQEFEDNAYHNSLHPLISEFAKTVALSSMHKEIESQNQIAELRAQLTIYRGFDGCRLQELIDADLDGRVIVLPCKRVFEPVWDTGPNCDFKCPESFDEEETCRGCTKSVPYAYERDCKEDDVIGANVFSTEEEAIDFLLKKHTK